VLQVPRNDGVRLELFGTDTLQRIIKYRYLLASRVPRRSDFSGNDSVTLPAHRSENDWPLSTCRRPVRKKPSTSLEMLVFFRRASWRP